MNRRQRRAQASTSPAAPEPAPPDVQDLFAEASQQHRAMRLDEAERLYRKILAIDPRHVDSLHMLGVAAIQLGRQGQALDLIGQALALRPDFAVARHNLAAALLTLGRTDEAIAAYRATLELKPDYAEAWVNLSIALQVAGRAAEALAASDRALAIEPGSAQAWYVRHDLKTFAPGDPDIVAMEALLAAAEARRLSPEGRIGLEFALGKAWMDVGDADRAFEHLNAGNRLKRAQLTYSVEGNARRFAAIAEAFTPEVMNRLAGGGDPSDLPILIVGMPRSGTTLTEQILASHPKVHGAGELTALQRMLNSVAGPDRKLLGYPQMMSALLPQDLATLGRAYVERLAALAQGKPRVVDKMPANFQFAGLVHLMLPNARIIHCRRDPIDVCLSCYSKNFSERKDFAYDLRELGRYYRAYEALMAHWRGLLPPERFIEVDYEAVVDDLEGQARRLVAFCGLDWDEACLDFHQTSRQVRTASVNQVRRPIYRSSLARWKPYEHHLAPLIEALK